MATMDIFNSDAFSMQQLTSAVQKIDYLPQMLGSLGIFAPKPIRTTVASIEQRDDTLGLIQTSPRGAPLEQLNVNKRKLHNVTTPRIAKGDTIYAHEIQNIRAFGSETELQGVQAEIAYRMQRIRQDVELTHENMRLGAVQGIVTDADASTIVNWFTVMGVSQDAEIDFDLDNASPASGAVRTVCTQVIRQTQRASKGAWTTGTRIVGLCGDTFWDQLVAHPEVRQTYLNTVAAAALREPAAWEQLNYGGITFVNYRGTDDGSTVAVGATKCKFFPVGAPGVFEAYFSPGESFDFVNTPGLPVYAMTIPDRDRNAWVQVEEYSYPLFVCTRPKMLQRAKNT